MCKAREDFSFLNVKFSEGGSRRCNNSITRIFKGCFVVTPKYNGVSIMFAQRGAVADELAASDACLTGCGGIWGDQYFHAHFPPYILALDMHINGLELLALSVCCKLWGMSWRGKYIDFNCDNLASVISLNTGRAKDIFMQKCLQEISYWAACYEFQIRAHHIAGVDNRIPDYLSRYHLGSLYKSQFLNLMVIQV